MKERTGLLKNLFDEMLVIRKKAMTKNEHKEKSMSQAHILGTIKMCEGISINEIAKKLNITGSAVTQFVDDFVADGWVERIEDAIDRRKMIVTITDKGKEKLNEFEGFFRDKIEKYLADVTEDELKVLVGILKKVNNKLV